MKKVIVRLANGLGNQLFTYSAAYSFAKKSGAKLFVDDKSGFYKRSKYELHNFNITAPLVDEKYKFVGKFARLRRKFLQKINNNKSKKLFLIENSNKNKLTNYDKNYFNVEFNEYIYFEGYFQTEKYFEKEKEELFKEFTFKKEIVKQKNLFVDQIKNKNSVSIHIRQDKYLPSEGHKSIDMLNKENFKNNIEISKKGIDYFDKKLKNPTYFVWSNNFNGLKEYFPTDRFIMVDSNLKKDPAYDLYLMSLCKHFILSPSTLHYWGAYLSKSEGKICLSPKNILTKSGYYGFSNNRDIKPHWWTDL